MGWCMTAASFQVGDRVRVHITREVLAGTRGVIHSRSLMVPSAYFVLFDGWPEVKSMDASHLERIRDEEQSSSAD